MSEERKKEIIGMLSNQTRNALTKFDEDGGAENLVPVKEFPYDVRISARTKTQKIMVWIVLIYMVASVVGGMAYVIKLLIDYFLAK
ncbi:MAG: hypothetical protein FWF35_05420 [Elusimicrobia bacterium]|nr:hypothetical protein [Elusimicrobiota bacterium]